MLKVVTEPATEPVTLAEAKLHCKVEISDDDTEITLAIAAARRRCESKIKRVFVTTGLRLTLDAFPCGLWVLTSSQLAIKLPRPPAIAVQSITYVDTSGATQTLDSSLYRLLQGEPGRIVPVYGQSWPSTRSEADAVTINYTAGYGAAASVPATLKMAILMLVGHWYLNREGVALESGFKLPLSVESLLNAEAWGSYA